MKFARGLVKLAMLASGALLASGAIAATWVPETITPIAGTNTGYFDADGFHYVFTTVDGISTAFYNANINQGSGEIAAIKDSGEFGLTSTSTVTQVVPSSMGDGVSANGFTVAPTNPNYNLMAVHVGLGEILFGWTPPNATSFTISSSSIAGGLTSAGNLSNWRAYQTDASGLVVASSIPEPQTYVMMLAGLLAVGFMVRRRNNGSAVNGSFAM